MAKRGERDSSLPQNDRTSGVRGIDVASSMVDSRLDRE